MKYNSRNKSFKKRGGQQYSKTINILNGYHLGDNLFTIIYLLNIKKYLIDNNIKVNYYIVQDYVAAIKEFITFPNVEIFVVSSNTPKNSTDIWIGNKNFTSNYFKNIDNSKMPFNDFLVRFFSEFATKLNLPTIKEFKYTDKELLTRYNNLNDIYKNNDILIINARARSGQYNYNAKKEDWNTLIKSLTNKYKIVTTEKVDNIPCTRDNNLTVKDIASISTSVKYIIAVNTGPLVACFNTYAFNKVKKWFIFCNKITYSYPNFYMNIPFDQLPSMLE
jgi:hypothetical protein